ncbi:MAG: glycosyl hydrolase [Candidatus Omnitrophica bacterium]|nr:glycosyl hydrolase [Candidatus Omnitrophota bacterium]
MKIRLLGWIGIFFIFAFCRSGSSETIVIGEKEGIIKPLFGVNAGPVMDDKEGRKLDLTKQFQSIGVMQIRTHDFYGYLDMSTMYSDQNADPSNPDSYDFHESDRVFRSILVGGFEPYLRIGDSWNAAAGFPVARKRAPANRANWVKAAVEVVRHYKEIAGTRLRYVEIWNEPDHRQFWDSSQQEFNVLFDETVKALKKAFPDIKVGGPAFTAAAICFEKNNMLVPSFLGYLKKNNTPIDFISWHLYSNDPNDFADFARFYRNELDKHNFQKAESHITEYNTDIKRLPYGIKPFELRVGSHGAAVLTAIWITLQNERVDSAFIYRGNDMSMDQPLFYGLLRANGSPKLSALAFSFWTRLAKCDRLIVKNPANNQKLCLIAGEKPTGDILLLIANISQQKIDYEVRNGKKEISGLVIEEISNEAEKIRTIRTNTCKASIPGHSVQLVTLKR